MKKADAIGAFRSSARSFEERIPKAQRKRLGQYFSGLPLGTLLAHIALAPEARNLIDPMAGSGDLLDAAATTAWERGIRLERLDGIELDAETASFCNGRASALKDIGAVGEVGIAAGSAFDPSVVAALGASSYDLVITNPPYVRYQTQDSRGSSANDVRRSLSAITEMQTKDSERALWLSLVNGYSGLADLSVPAWLLSALLTRPGGRLALIVPATWRSRDYADIVRYLLLRAFHLEFVVADTQPGWFSDALVRTHLVVARRLPWKEAQVPLSRRARLPTASWLQISPEASSEDSLVGCAFPGPEPEREFATWAHSMNKTVVGVEGRRFSLDQEWGTLVQRLKRKSWFQSAEEQHDSTQHSSAWEERSAVIPAEFRSMLPDEVKPNRLQSLEQSGIKVGQGLRTGCNRFFYVTHIGEDVEGTEIVEASNSFQSIHFRVPTAVLRPVLHRQSEVLELVEGRAPATRVLDLSGWVLPDDRHIVKDAADVYHKHGMPIPETMPHELASFVRLAARHAPNPKNPGRLIPDLSAVRTNVRGNAENSVLPRFWYMLPAFRARHLPALYAPRVNHGNPTVLVNENPRILIDANFSTIWSDNTKWTPYALYALFQSSWCRAAMEAFGTPLGGGALKLEATQIRQIPVPLLSARDCMKLDKLGWRLAVDPSALNQRHIDDYFLTVSLADQDADSVRDVANYIDNQIKFARAARQGAFDDD